MNNFNKYNNILLAGAIGDAFGYTVEFDKWESIKYKFGENGIQLNLKENNIWIVSDDTQMTLFCLNGIIKHLKNNTKNIELINDDIYKCFLDWHKTQNSKDLNNENDLGKFKIMHNREAPGITCLNALSSNKKGLLTKKINDSKGCGGIMRVAPISFLNLEIKEIFKLGCMQAALTHSHTDGYLSSGFFAGLLNLLIKGKEFNNAFKENINILKEYPEHEYMLIYLEKVQKLINSENILQHTDLNNMIGEGWVGEEALGIALYAAQKGSSLENVLDIASNHDGDSDSTASLAAQLYVAENDLSEKFKDEDKNLNIYEPFNFVINKLEKVL